MTVGDPAKLCTSSSSRGSSSGGFVSTPHCTVLYFVNSPTHSPPMWLAKHNSASLTAFQVNLTEQCWAGLVRGKVVLINKVWGADGGSWEER